MNTRMYIDGRWVDAQGGGTWTVVNPATEEPVAEVAFGDARDAEAGIAAAAAAQPAWAALTAYARGAILQRAAALIAEKMDDLALIMTLESGKPLAESRGEWQACADIFDWFAEEGKRAYGRAIPSRNANKRLLTLLTPVGVAATITAWNFPAYLAARKWAAALAAGCTVVGRPSELTPLCAFAIAGVLEEAGLPAGVLNVVNGQPGPIGEAFLRSPHVEKLSFTGSQKVGQLLMRGAADGIKRLSLELGGSAPVIVLPDADVEDAATRSVAAKFRNNGQVCISPSRFFVHHDIAEDFLEASREAIERLVVGDGREGGVTTGPMITSAGRERVEEFVADATTQGARVVCGGGRVDRAGFFYQPTLLYNLHDDMRAMREEVFGPVMLVRDVESLEDALQQANGTPYGLAGYVLGRDMSSLIRAAEGLRFGIVGVNDLTPATAEGPFGGMKQSGFGRENSQEGLTEYMETKFVSIGI